MEWFFEGWVFYYVVETKRHLFRARSHRLTPPQGHLRVMARSWFYDWLLFRWKSQGTCYFQG